MEIIKQGSGYTEYVPSKSSLKRDLAYVREMCRQIEAALKSEDYADGMEAANEGSAALAGVMETLGNYKAIADGEARIVKHK